MKGKKGCGPFGNAGGAGYGGLRNGSYPCCGALAPEVVAAIAELYGSKAAGEYAFRQRTHWRLCRGLAKAAVAQGRPDRADGIGRRAVEWSDRFLLSFVAAREAGRAPGGKDVRMTPEGLVRESACRWAVPMCPPEGGGAVRQCFFSSPLLGEWFALRDALADARMLVETCGALLSRKEKPACGPARDGRRR